MYSTVHLPSVPNLSMRVVPGNLHQAFLTIRFKSESKPWLLFRLLSSHFGHALLIALLLIGVTAIAGIGSSSSSGPIIFVLDIGHREVAGLRLQLQWLLLLLSKVGGLLDERSLVEREGRLRRRSGERGPKG